jgi:hypothetical protein
MFKASPLATTVVMAGPGTSELSLSGRTELFRVVVDEGLTVTVTEVSTGAPQPVMQVGSSKAGVKRTTHDDIDVWVEIQRYPPLRESRLQQIRVGVRPPR